LLDLWIQEYNQGFCFGFIDDLEGEVVFNDKFEEEYSILLFLRTIVNWLAKEPMALL
jgi:hypothetical protein